MMNANRLITLVLAVMLTTPAAAQSLTIPLVANFENPDYQPFYDHLGQHLGGKVTSGQLVIERSGEPGNGSIASFGLAEGTIAVFADVTAKFQGPPDPNGLFAGPGIIIRDASTSGPRSFFALILQSDGYVVSAWAGGVKQTIAGALDPATLTKPVRLAAVETPSGAEFFVNGESVATVEDPSITGHRTGLIVFGSGTFTYDNFGLNSLGDAGLGGSTPNAPAPVGPAPVGPAPVTLEPPPN